ncbi:MAG: response regulator, partial [Micromonosporaceae bacterium]|nr:response regulator [Micromonosporaceae bacterium]
ESAERGREMPEDAASPPQRQKKPADQTSGSADGTEDQLTASSTPTEAPSQRIRTAHKVGSDADILRISTRSKTRMVVASRDNEVRTRLSVAAAAAGWTVKAASDVETALAVSRGTATRIALVDLSAQELTEAAAARDSGSAGEPASASLTGLASRVPTMVLSETDAPALRVEAVRAGAVGFLSRTAPASAIVAFATQLVAARSTEPMTIVVVDHGGTHLEAVRVALAAPDYDLIVVEGVLGCLEAIRSARPSAILVGLGPQRDLSDPEEVDPVTLCRVIRSDPAAQAIPVMIYSPPTNAAIVEGVFRAGADDLIVLPVSRFELRARIWSRGARGRALAFGPHQAPVAPAAAPVPLSKPLLGRTVSPAVPAATTSEGAAGTSPTGQAALALPDAAGAEQPETVDIVVVEDDPSVADVIDYALQFRGLRIKHLSDGIEAAEGLCGGRLTTRLVILDVGLPGLDGFGVLTRLRDAGVLTRTPVIMLTARSSEAETLTALGLGAADHIAKPFSVPILISRVERALGRQGPRQ